MNKKRKIINVSEDVMNEIINMDGDFIKGGRKQFPGNSMIKTSTNMHKDDGLSWTSDDQIKAAVTRQTYGLRGYSTGTVGSMSETYLIEDDLNEEDLIDKSKKLNIDLISKKNNSELMSSEEKSIPSLEELRNDSYNLTDVLSKCKQLINLIKSNNSSENYDDIVAIVINEILNSFDLNGLKQEHYEELKSYFNG
jgi:hypothetical protein